MNLDTLRADYATFRTWCRQHAGWPEDELAQMDALIRRDVQIGDAAVLASWAAHMASEAEFIRCHYASVREMHKRVIERARLERESERAAA